MKDRYFIVTGIRKQKIAVRACDEGDALRELRDNYGKFDDYEIKSITEDEWDDIRDEIPSFTAPLE